MPANENFLVEKIATFTAPEYDEDYENGITYTPEELEPEGENEEINEFIKNILRSAEKKPVNLQDVFQTHIFFRNWNSPS